MNNLINEYKEKQHKRIKDREKLAYKFESGKIINLAALERKETTKGAIFDYYKHKHFLNDFNKETQGFLFITFTLNPKHNKTLEEEQITSIQRQNEIFERYFTLLIKNYKIHYIKIKELTKKGNIHLHTLFKIDRDKLKKFIETIEKQRGENIGIVNIKTEKDTIKFDNKKQYLQVLEIKNKKALIKSSLNDTEAKNYISKGSFIELEELEQFEANNVKNYILKYIKKNMETNSNNESNEHIIFKIANIKKMTTSQMTKKEQKKEFLNYYYFIASFENENTKNLDLVAMFENKEHFKEWEEWKAVNKTTKPELLDLTKKEHLAEYYNNIIDSIEEREERETFKTKAIKEVLNNLEEHLANKKDIEDLIKEEYIIQKELFEKEEQSRFLKNEEYFEKIFFKWWLRDLRTGLKQFKKMSEEELSQVVENRSKRRKYTKKIIEVYF
ncbi:MAG: hypothetical protein RBT59_00915 [Arcobacteraceae bacterium]|jgi:hypothetical protein|nr:hypothetical protein [Arcobacteraceae bacterium]